MHKVDEYHEKHSTYLKLLTLRIDLVPPELGRAEQAITIEVLAKDGTQVLSTQFTGVQQLRIDGVTPGCSCYLQIVSVNSRPTRGTSLQGFQRRTGLNNQLLLQGFPINPIACVAIAISDF